jgi:hypothetical protein
LWLLRIGDTTTRCLADRVLSGPYNDDDIEESGLLRRLDDVPHHRPSRELMKHLRSRRAHALALASGHDDDGPTVASWRHMYGKTARVAAGSTACSSAG